VLYLKVLVLYLKRPQTKLGRRAALGGRFRYSDLKEALTAVGTMGVRWR
jgi:hypothetical protein